MLMAGDNSSISLNSERCDRTAVRAQHATQQSCLPGYRHLQITLRVGRRGVLLATHPQLP
jgi:hypothetical protein